MLEITRSKSGINPVDSAGTSPIWGILITKVATYARIIRYELGVVAF